MVLEEGTYVGYLEGLVPIGYVPRSAETPRQLPPPHAHTLFSRCPVAQLFVPRRFPVIPFQRSIHSRIEVISDSDI